MRTLGVNIKENPYYAPYDDECWIELAKEIMSTYADRYSYQLPTTAFSQEEYAMLDKRTYLPIRRSILRNVKYGPLRNLANMPAIYYAFERRRLEYKKSLGITWREPKYEDPTKF